MDPKVEQMAKEAYVQYIGTTGRQMPDGTPAVLWDQLPIEAQLAWGNAAQAAHGIAIQQIRSELSIDHRQHKQIEHALWYDTSYADAGVPGHGQFVLLAKLARALGFR